MSNCKQCLCEECGQGYDYKKNLRQHVRTKHPGKVDLSFLENKKKNCKFKCNSCDKKFSHFRNLSFHERKYHTNLQPHELTKNPGKIDDVASNRKKKNLEFKCKSCNRQYNLFRNLRYHERKFHSTEIVSKNSFKCSLCEFRLNTKTSFLNHLESEHSAGVKSQDLEFSSFEDFVKWKQNVEKETFSRTKKQDFMIAGTGPRRHYTMFDWVLDYFGRAEGLAHPLYLQHQGHSRTIVGVEVLYGERLNLLVLDPIHRPHQMSQLYDPDTAGEAMELLRLSLDDFRQPYYQVLAVSGVMGEREHQRSRGVLAPGGHYGLY
ncbi:zinc finger protein 761-like isoform X1 [Bacillus rossius redtenbacheri]|uniref:zinc finger protein 761-like isoform X1 n=1 Tax=Bacillus rossius redtenbacheri TaxID=93214 RepID=UPI002FDCBB42